MKVKSVKIQNFKSFAEENNRIDLDKIITVIGKIIAKQNYKNGGTKLWQDLHFPETSTLEKTLWRI